MRPLKKHMADYLGINPPGLMYAQDSLVQGQRNTAIPMTYTDTAFGLANGVPPQNYNSVQFAAVNGSQYLGDAVTDSYGGLQLPSHPNTSLRTAQSRDHRFVATQQQSCSGGVNSGFGAASDSSLGGYSAGPTGGFSTTPFKAAGGFAGFGAAGHAYMADQIGALGAGVISPGENQWARRGLNQLSRTNVQHPQHIVAPDTQGMRPLGKAAQWGDFGDGLFNNDNMQQFYERKHLTGVFVNTNDGKMYETYEDDLPPPNTDKSMDPEQLKRANPQLIAHQGGIDFNRPPPQKREVQKNLPGADGGSNRWGDALYAEGRRKREREIAAASIWGNRDGNYSVEPIMDGRPNGYVGFQNMVRTAPYVPPTQRGRTDTAWEAPSHLAEAGAAQTTTPLQQLRPYLKEVMTIPVANPNSHIAAPVIVNPHSDMSEVDRAIAADYTGVASAENPSFALRVYKVDLPDTMRALDEGKSYTGALYAVENYTSGQLHFTYESDLEETLRAAMEASPNSIAAHTQVASGLPGANGGYVLGRDGDLADPYRGTDDTYKFVTPVRISEGHENGGLIKSFCMSKSARPAREMGTMSLPARAPETEFRLMNPVTCKKRSADVNYQARAADLNLRPTYMGEASVS